MAQMHYRWQCPGQRTNYLANDVTCPRCRCYVCNIALQTCGVNSHKWAAPHSVLNWENLRPRVLPWVPLNGIELLSMRLRVGYVREDYLLDKTGISAPEVVQYMTRPVPGSLWNFIKDAVRIDSQDLLSILCNDRDQTALCFMGHQSYVQDVKRNIFVTLQWITNHPLEHDHFHVVLKIRRTVWNVFLTQAHARIPLRPVPLALMPVLPVEPREMFPHQKDALRDMFYIEQHSISPVLWQSCRDEPAADKVYVQRHVQNIFASGAFFVREENCAAPDSMIYGGVLANDRGTGKTYVVAALIRAHPAPAALPPPPALYIADQPADDADDDDNAEVLMPVSTALPPNEQVFVPQTLVVVPAANLLHQWVDELEMLDLKVLVHHGRTRVQSVEHMQEFDVVLTTADTLRSAWFGTVVTVFHRVKFWRVVWDECHRLLQGSAFTRAGIAAVHINARNRWCLTATPDWTFSRSRLYAQIIAGWPQQPGLEDNSLVHRFIAHPGRYTNDRNNAFMRPLIIRYDAAANVMPEVRIQRHNVPLENQPAYEQVIVRVRQTGNRHGGTFLMRVFNNLLATVNGVGPMKWPSVTVDPEDDSRPEVPADNYDCSICWDALRRPVRTACNHYYCEACMERWLRNAQGCPLCRQNALPLVRCAEIVADEGGVEDETLAPSGAKAAFLISLIERLLAQPPDHGEPHRVLVFSRYVQMRHLLLQMLGPAATDDIAAFHAGRAPVLIMSFLSGSVGLNLMQANHVVLCEPCFRSSTEEQAIGRAARLGQRRVVHVHYVQLAHTVEETMTMLPRTARLSIQQAFGLI